MKTNIYFIQKDSDIKIGRSIDIERRIEELQIANSVNLKLLYYIENVDDSFETHLHEVCSRFNIRGEWFSEGVLGHLLKHPFYKENMKKYYPKSNASLGSAVNS